MDPLFVDDLRQRYQDRLDEAEQWGRAKRAGVHRVSRVDRLRIGIGDRWRAGIGDRLIALEQYLKATAHKRHNSTRRHPPVYVPVGSIHKDATGVAIFGEGIDVRRATWNVHGITASG